MAKIYWQTVNLRGDRAAQFANLVRHFEPRLSLGSARIVCERLSPSLVRELIRLWHELITEFQAERDLAPTIELELLMTTHIIDMQNLRIGGHGSGADLTIGGMPTSDELTRSGSRTVYFLDPPNPINLIELIKPLAKPLLIVSGPPPAVVLPLITDKSQLDKAARAAWRKLENFLLAEKIDASCLEDPQSEAASSALERLLDEKRAIKFLALHDEFMWQAAMASPLNWHPATKRRQLSAIVLIRQLRAFLGNFTKPLT